jgi:ribosomal protein S18 acetylase RimI-like enzyme
MRPGSASIRRAGADDREAMYVVCLRTGDSGRDATGHYDDERLLGLVYVGPYLSLQPELAFALVEPDDPEDRAQGYCLGALNTLEFRADCEVAWWPQLRADYLLDVPRRKADQELVRLIHEPPFAPRDIALRYPSHLHIDLLEPVRGRGVGALAIQTQLEAMADLGSPGVHLVVSTMNAAAIGFYEHLGFVRVGGLPGAWVMARDL